MSNPSLGRVSFTFPISRLGCVQVEFATAIYKSMWPARNEYHKSLLEEIDRLSAIPGSAASNFGGWQSPWDLHCSTSSPMQKLLAWITDCTVDYCQYLASKSMPVSIQSAWANINRAGDMNLIHSHGSADVAGIYYLCIPDSPDDTGPLVLHDPRLGNCSDNNLFFQPQIGMLLLFPGWLRHSVLPFRSLGRRVSVSVNLTTEFTS